VVDSLGHRKEKVVMMLRECVSEILKVRGPVVRCHDVRNL